MQPPDAGNGIAGSGSGDTVVLSGQRDVQEWFNSLRALRLGERNPLGQTARLRVLERQHVLLDCDRRHERRTGDLEQRHQPEGGAGILLQLGLRDVVGTATRRA